MSLRITVKLEKVLFFFGAMVDISSLFSTKNVLLGVPATSKKRVFELASQTFARLYELPEKEVFEGLNNREKLGSTYLGHGLSIPHARLPGITSPATVFIRLQEPLAMTSDGKSQTTDLFFVIAPEDNSTDHLDVLALTVELFSDEEMRAKLRDASTAEDFCSLIRTWAASHAEAPSNN
jgi:PTS system nitrogen regulatory IIA component